MYVELNQCLLCGKQSFNLEKNLTGTDIQSEKDLSRI